ncbi:MAG: excinuclease ABC subunit C [Parcubacteria group bacterium]|nr:excinuclease ABC subunit C [Parcubacteria group bacterium]
MKQYAIYMLTNWSNKVLYTGVTGDLKKRIWIHREKISEGFTKDYNATKLVYYELFDNPEAAIKREKQIKAGSRKKKNDLVEKENPEWGDLYGELWK